MREVRCRIAGFAAGMLAFASAPVAAQTAPPPETADGANDIIVLGRGLATPPGTPAYGSVTIDRARLSGDASGRIEDVLLDVAGFQQFRRSDSRSANPSAQSVTLRALGGNASSRALVLLDGVPQADPFFGYIPFNAVQPERLASARVTRGGGSGPFGAGAVAGTIELASATRADLPLVAGSAFYGSRDAQSVSAVVSPDVGAGYVSVYGDWERGDGFYTTPADERVPASVRARYRDWSGGLRAVAPIDAETEVQANMLVFRDDRTLRFAGADSSSGGEDASVRLIRRGAWQVDALAYLQARNFTNKTISATSFRLTLDQRDTPATGYGGKIELRPPVGADHVLRIGADARYADGQLYEDAYSTVTGLATAHRTAGGTNGTIGAFVEDDWTLGSLVLTGGARADRWSISDGFFREASATPADNRFPTRTGVAFTGRAGAVWHVAPALALRGAGYTGFRLPTLNELYRPFNVVQVRTLANADLKLERLKGIEGGIDLTPARGITLGLTGFYNRLDDPIANVSIGPDLRQRENLDAIVARGIELSAAARRGAASLIVSYAYSDSRIRASGLAAPLDGVAPAQSPRNAASATLGWQPARGPGGSITVRYVGEQNEDDPAADPLPGVVTADAVLSLPVTRHVALVGRAENVFDATVITRNTGPDTLGPIDLGTPRTLWIGVRLR